MQTRRNFIGNVATGIGSLAAGGVLSANERLRIGVIGVGERGTQLAREAMACPGVELAAFADVYARRLTDAAGIAPGAGMHADYRSLLDDQSINAVIIATPQHLHAEPFVAALESGKHVYVEKAMALTVEEAKGMRAAYEKAGQRAVQVGHQWCSSGQVADGRNYLGSGLVGKVTAIHAHMFRNTPRGKAQWQRPVYPDMTPETVAWKGFLGSAPERDFDPDRLVNWRLFWDYSGGNVHENMSHQIAFWHKTMGLAIPHSATMTGGVHLWRDGREVPDTMHVSLQYSGGARGEDILFSWDSGFGNSQPGVSEEALGTDGTIVRSQQIRYIPQKVNRPEASELMGRTITQPRAHMQDFVDAIRTGKETTCPFGLGYAVSVACRMAVLSYWSGRTVHWDPATEEIV
ncbi:MAG TPA: Gfo/Idh/MocA family oxidoreductase [Bryobacteraceae bacterium]|nr:Gfo/Idh/MocA family oxidoreductase [Bryobacteraceae bacterium]